MGVNFWRQAFLAFLLSGLSNLVFGYQIAPVSSAWEEKLTREPTSNRARVAGVLGRLIKGPVHEEITQLALGCPTSDSDLPGNTQCASADAGFATQFINYGVRWNDLPPFSLSPDQGKRCKKFIGSGSACNVQQTIRFSTQPECWYCMFTAAEKVAASGRKIVGCLPPKREKGARFLTSHLLARSHYGDLQFLHGMAPSEGTDASVTRGEILGWTEFAWKVASREIVATTLLKDIDIPLMRDRFHCSGWSVADLYVLGRQDTMLRYVHDIAFGSILHTVQDSFAEGHVEREVPVAGQKCSADVAMQRPGRIVEFHSYGGQDGHLHDAKDLRLAMTGSVGGRVSDAVEASRQLADYYGRRSKWAEVRPYMECLFDLSDRNRKSSAGDQFRKR